VALQPELFTLLMDTLMPLAVVESVALLTMPMPLPLPMTPKLQAYPPRYNENDPPYELAPYLLMPVVVAVQPELFTLLMDTFTSLADALPLLLLLLLKILFLLLRLQAYPPR